MGGSGSSDTRADGDPRCPSLPSRGERIGCTNLRLSNPDTRRNALDSVGAAIAPEVLPVQPFHVSSGCSPCLKRRGGGLEFTPPPAAFGAPAHGLCPRRRPLRSRDLPPLRPQRLGAAGAVARAVAQFRRHRRRGDPARHPPPRLRSRHHPLSISPTITARPTARPRSTSAASCARTSPPIATS